MCLRYMLYYPPQVQSAFASWFNKCAPAKNIKCLMKFCHLNIKPRLPNFGESCDEHSAPVVTVHCKKLFLLSDASSVSCVFQGGQHNSVSPLAVLGLLKSFGDSLTEY